MSNVDGSVPAAGLAAQAEDLGTFLGTQTWSSVKQFEVSLNPYNQLLPFSGEAHLQMAARLETIRHFHEARPSISRLCQSGPASMTPTPALCLW